MNVSDNWLTLESSMEASGDVTVVTFFYIFYSFKLNLLYLFGKMSERRLNRDGWNSWPRWQKVAEVPDTRRSIAPKERGEKCTRVMFPPPPFGSGADKPVTPAESFDSGMNADCILSARC